MALLNDLSISGLEARASQQTTDAAVLLQSSNPVQSDISKLSQSFTVVTAYDLAAIEFKMRRHGGPSGNCHVKIHLDDSGVPGALIATSDPVLTTSISTSTQGAPQLFIFSSPVHLESGIKYHALFEYAERSTVDGANYVRALILDSDGLSGGNLSTFAANTWTSLAKDAVIRVLALTNVAAYSTASWFPRVGADAEPTAILYKIGKMVSLNMPRILKADGGAAIISALNALPAGFRPNVALRIPLVVKVGSTSSVAYVAIGTDGSLQIFADLADAVFPSGQAADVAGFSVSFAVD